MKILLLCKKFPYPLKDGESIAIHILSQALSNMGCEVSLLAMNTSKHYFEGNEYPPEADHFKRIQTVAVDNRLKPLAAFQNLFSDESYHISRFVSEKFSGTLRQMLREEDYDIVQLETLYLAPYIDTIRRYSDALVSMRAHNVEHEIWERITSHTGNGLKRWYLRHLTAKLRRFETHALNKYDILLPITERDLRYFRKLGSRTPAVVTPIGLSAEKFLDIPPPEKQTFSISFIGSLDWMPNLEGLEWFIQRAWPLVHEAFPELELHIAGRNTPASLYNLKKPNISVHGEVPQSVPFINAHPLMIVPLLSGSGMRAKILEGMALGKVVITTSIGMEGISATDRENILVANTPDQFLDCLRYVLQSPERLRSIGERARRFVCAEYESLGIANRVVESYASHLVPAI